MNAETKTERALPSPNGECLISLGERTNDPLLQLFAHYATGWLPTGETAQSLSMRTPNFEYTSFQGLLHHSLDDPPSTNEERYDALHLNTSEQRAFDNELALLEREANAYSREILSTDEDCMEMIRICVALDSDVQNGNSRRRKYNYHEAEVQARASIASRYGRSDVEEIISEDVNARKDYLRQVAHFEQQDYFLNGTGELTLAQTRELLRATLISQASRFIFDLSRLAEVRVITQNGTTVLTADRFQDLEVVERLRPNGGPTFTYTNVEFGLLFENNHGLLSTGDDVGGLTDTEIHDRVRTVLDLSMQQLDGSVRFDKHEPFFMLWEYLCNGYLDNKQNLSSDELKSVLTFRSRYILIDAMSWAYQQLLNRARYDDPNLPLSQVRRRHSISYLENVLTSLRESPHDLVMGSSWQYGQSDNSRYRRIENYLKWQFILLARETGNYPDIDINPNPAYQHSLDQLVQRVLRMEGLENIDLGHRDINHTLHRANRQMMTARHLFRERLRMHLKPSFIITNNSEEMEDQEAFKGIDELSTYPDQAGLEFLPYEITNPDSSGSGIVITSHSQIAVGVVGESRIVRIYAPEYARIVSFKLEDEGGKVLVQGRDYYLEYENTTGHYRAVLVGATFKKDRDVKYKYEVGVGNARKIKKENVVDGFEVVGIDDVRHVAEEMIRFGYIQMGVRLRELVESAISGKRITTKDIEKAIKSGSRYSFESSDGVKGDGQEYPYPSYMPLPDNEGFARVQCQHSARLLSLILQRAIPGGSFYASNMFRVVEVEPGVKHVGVRHSDVRGRLNDSVVRHDATPAIEARKVLAEGESDRQEIIGESVHVNSYRKIYERFIGEILAATNTDSARVSFPRSVITLAQTLDEVARLGESLDNVSGLREGYVERLQVHRETWELVSTDVGESNVKQRAMVKLFGPFTLRSSIALSAIDSAIELLEG